MDARTAAALDRVLALVPAYARHRDDETGGLLRALAEAVAAELAVLENDVAELYDSWFAETCPEWVLPYLADLLGVVELPPDLGTELGIPPLGGAGGAGVSRRAFVAGTVAYRRRKGTPAAIERVARDVSGWPARVVEHHRLLAVTTHVALPRPDRPVTADLRTGASGRLDLVSRRVAQGSLNPLARTPDVRRPGAVSRPGLRRLAVFLFPRQVWQMDAVPAQPTAEAHEWSLHPLGLDTPLHGRPAAEPDLAHLAGEADLPVPLRDRRLLDLLTAARRPDATEDDRRNLQAVLQVSVRTDPAAAADELTAGQLLVNGLEAPGRAAGTPWQVLVDVRRGRFSTFHDGQPANPAELLVTCAAGATAQVGAGTYDRRPVHAEVLAADATRDGWAEVRRQAAAAPAGRCSVALRQALADAERRWQLEPRLLGHTSVIVLTEPGRYDGDVEVHVPAGTRLVLVAASWNGTTPGAYDALGLQAYVAGGLTVSGGAGSSVILDGLVVHGNVTVAPGDLGSLTLCQCTVAGDVVVEPGGSPQVALVRTACLPQRRPAAAGTAEAVVRFGAGVGTLRMRDSSLDAPAGRPAVHGAQLAVVADGSTVRGGLTARTLDASNCLLDGPVIVRHRQTGGLRYCYAPPAAQALRRYHCVPETDDPSAAAAPAPLYASTDAGAPDYLALGVPCAPEIARGGEGGSEMGVHHHLGRLLRRQATERLLADYVPAGLEYGVFAPLPR